MSLKYRELNIGSNDVGAVMVEIFLLLDGCPQFYNENAKLDAIVCR